MKKFLAMFLRHWRRSPIKIALTILSLAVGTGILILSFSASGILKTEISDKLAANGTILYVSNGTMENDGSIERAMPAQWDQTAGDQLLADTEAIDKAAIVLSAPIDELNANSQSWRLRSTVGSTPAYFDIFDLPIVAGRAMEAADVDSGSRQVWLGESLATIIFGQAEAAIGQYVQPPGRMFGRGPGSRERNLIVQYQVAGVYRDPQEILRRSYGIADMVFPWTSMLSISGDRSFAMKMFANTLVVRSRTLDASRTKALVSSAMTNTWGTDLQLAVWEGSPRGQTSYLQELRDSVSIFSTSINLLGMVLLALAAVGIFSIMVVESLGRQREIALERAIGASQGRVIREFWIWSLFLSGIGAFLGAVLALILAGPVLDSLAPLVGEVSSQFKSAAGLGLLPLLGGAGLSLVLGGLLGALPALGAVRGGIAETLREE